MSMPAAANHAGLAPSRRLWNVDEASVALIHKDAICLMYQRHWYIYEKQFGWCLENAIHFTAATIHKSACHRHSPEDLNP